MYCALHGVLRAGGGSASENEALARLMHRANTAYKDVLARQFQSSGASFTALIRVAGATANIAEYLLRSVSGLALGIGIGAASNASAADEAGSELHKCAKEALSRASVSPGGFALCYRTGGQDETLLNALSHAIDALVRAWTQKQREAVRATRDADNQQIRAAQVLGVAPSTVSRHLSAAQYDLYMEQVGALGAYLAAAYDTGTDDIALASINAATLLREKGDYAGALEALNNALVERTQSLGSSHPDVADVYVLMGDTAQNANALDEALAFFEKALAIREETLGTEHMDTARAFLLLAEAYLLKSENGKALECFQHALRTLRALYPDGHPDAARAYKGVGDVLRARGDSAHAHDCYARALSIAERTLGDEHPNTAALHAALGNVAHDSGDNNEALLHYRRALTLCGKAEKSALHASMGGAYLAMNKCAEALECFEKALAHAVPESVASADILNSTGNAHLRERAYRKAGACYEKALAIYEANYGAHLATATALRNIAVAHQGAGDVAGALSHFERARVMLEALYGSSYPGLAQIYLAIGRQKDARTALEYFTRALHIYEQQGTAKKIASTCTLMGGVYQALKEYGRARMYYERAIMLEGESAERLFTLGTLLRASGERENALQYFERALSASPSPEKQEVLYRNIASIYREQGEGERAMEYLLRALNAKEGAGP